MEENLFNALTVTFSSSSYVASDGYTIHAILSGVTSLPLLPSVEIDGFYVFLNDIPISVKTAYVENPSGSATQKATVILKTYVKIKSTDTVKIKHVYVDLTDNSTTPIPDLSLFTITINNSTENKYFDPNNWNTGLDDGNVVIGTDSGFFTDSTDLFKKELTFPFAEVILDTKPPEGVVIINESTTTGGIDVRTFAAYAPFDSSDSGYTSRNLTLSSSAIEGWQFISSTEQTINSFVIQLKFTQLSTPTPAIGNQTGRVVVSLYSNTTGDIPNTQIIELGVIQYDTLTNAYQEFSLTPLSPVTLSSQTIYWIVLSFETIVKSGVTSSGTIDILVKTNDTLNYAVFESNAWRRLAQKQFGYLKLVGSKSDGDAIPSDIMAQDIIGKNLYQATNFGGSTNTSQYEKIGAGDAYFLNMYLTPDSTSGLYPLVQSIDVGATSSRSKSYIVETKLTPKSNWETLYYNSSSTTTTDFIRYKFNIPTRFSNIRIGYRGDLLANIEAGTLTIAGSDEWSDVVEVQASHFSDFRDADEFENVNTRAWAPFTEGASVYNWNVTNQSRLWEKLDNYSDTGFLRSAPISSQMVLASYQKVSVAQGTAQRAALNLSLIGTGDVINAIAVHNSVVYVGTELGYIYQSSQGDYWTIINQKNPLDLTEYKTLPPVTALTSHAGALYIGTKKTTTKNASVYKYFDKKFTAIKTDFTENKISALASDKGFLFVGTAGKFGTLEASVRFYDGTTFTKLATAAFDQVQSMIYSTALNTIVVGYNGGQVWKLVYNSSNNPASWTRIQASGDSNIFNINDDSSGKFLFVSTDKALYSYVKSLDTFKTLSYPKYSNPGLQLTWKQFAAAGSTDYKNDRDFTFVTATSQESSINEFNLSTSKPTGIGVSYYTAVFEGAIKAPTTASYQFLIKTNTNIRLTVNGNILTSSSLWTTESDVTTNTLTNNFASQTVSMVKDTYYPIKLEVAVKETGVYIPKVSLFWQDTSSAFEDSSAVSATYFYKPNVITSVNNLVNSYLGSGLDGSSYSFDPSFYETTKRYVYVRLKDEAGNYHNYRLSDGTTPYESLNDFIYQGDTGGGDPIPGLGYIKFAPTSVLAGNTAVATLRLPNSVNTTSIYTITTDGNSTSDVSSVTVPANSLSANFNVTVNSTVATTLTSTVVTATLGSASYKGTLNITPSSGGGGGGDNNTSLKGVIYQVKAEMNPAVTPITYIPSVTDAIYSPKRKVRSTGSYVNQPFYVPTLSQWTSMTVLILNEYNLNTAVGLDAGTEVNVYIRTSDTSAGCFTTPWSSAYSKSYINNSSAPLTAETLTIDLQAFSGKFIQYYIELVSATQGDTPEVKAVTITYKAATGSYFFTKTFNTEDYSTTIPTPTFRRGLLTSNQDKKDGEIVYGYTTDDRDGYKYDFGRYTIIEPNKTFELETPSSTIKFAILLTSIDGDPSIVYDFAVQLDAGDEDMKFMPEL